MTEESDAMVHAVTTLCDAWIATGMDDSNREARNAAGDALSAYLEETGGLYSAVVYMATIGALHVIDTAGAELVAARKIEGLAFTTWGTEWGSRQAGTSVQRVLDEDWPGLYIDVTVMHVRRDLAELTLIGLRDLCCAVEDKTLGVRLIR